MIATSLLLLGGCAANKAGPSAPPDGSARFETQLAQLCSELGDAMEMVDASDTAASTGETMLTNLESFRDQLDELDVPDARSRSFADLTAAVDSSVESTREQIEATEARDLQAALEGRAEAAAAKLEIYEVVEDEDLPAECAGDSRDALEARVFAGEADIICFEFVDRFTRLIGNTEGRSLDPQFIAEDAAPEWREFVDDLRSVRPDGSARPAAERMIALYDRAGDALLDLADALEKRSETKGLSAQDSFYSSSKRADEITESFGLTQCSDILGLGQAS